MDYRVKEYDSKMALRIDRQSQTLTSLFTYKAVELAHRGVEDCHEKLMQELLSRRSKENRKLQLEEAHAAKREARERLQAEQYGSPTEEGFTSPQMKVFQDSSDREGGSMRQSSRLGSPPALDDSQSGHVSTHSKAAPPPQESTSRDHASTAKDKPQSPSTS